MKNKRSSEYSKEIKAKVALVFVDLLGVFISLILGFVIANFLNYTTGFSAHTFLNASYGFYIFYLIIPFIFFHEGLYTYRYDFWHELRLILKGLFVSSIVVFAYLALTKDIGGQSRAVILLSFLIMAILIPFFKLCLKKKLFQIGIWKLGVKVLNDDLHLESEIFNNPYLGYIKSSRTEASIVFINSQEANIENVKKQLEKEISSKNKVMFVPVFNNYQFSSSDIFELTDSRTNLVVLQNKLSSHYRMFINITYNYILAILLLPVLLPIIGVIALLIKKDSKGPIFFMQKRLGVDGKVFWVYKFRTMHINGDEILQTYLKEHPEEVKNYEIYCKYENDPRITKIGRI